MSILSNLSIKKYIFVNFNHKINLYKIQEYRFNKNIDEFIYKFKCKSCKCLIWIVFRCKSKFVSKKNKLIKSKHSISNGLIFMKLNDLAKIEDDVLSCKDVIIKNLIN